LAVSLETTVVHWDSGFDDCPNAAACSREEEEVGVKARTVQPPHHL
jgi:hypothetical protein